MIAWHATGSFFFAFARVDHYSRSCWFLLTRQGSHNRVVPMLSARDFEQHANLTTRCVAQDDQNRMHKFYMRQNPRTFSCLFAILLLKLILSFYYYLYYRYNNVCLSVRCFSLFILDSVSNAFRIKEDFVINDFWHVAKHANIANLFLCVSRRIFYLI